MPSQVQIQRVQDCQKEYYKRHRERIAEYKRAYYKAHREEYLRRNRKQRAAKRIQPVSEVSHAMR